MLFFDDGRRPLNERTSLSAVIEFSGRVTEAESEAKPNSNARQISLVISINGRAYEARHN